jgi:hypothetical protein
MQEEERVLDRIQVRTHRTGYLGEENWEGGGPPYKPIYMYIKKDN